MVCRENKARSAIIGILKRQMPPDADHRDVGDPVEPKTHDEHRRHQRQHGQAVVEVPSSRDHRARGRTEEERDQDDRGDRRPAEVPLGQIDHHPRGVAAHEGDEVAAHQQEADGVDESGDRGEHHGQQSLPLPEAPHPPTVIA